MKKITVVVRPEHAGGSWASVTDCLLARATSEAVGEPVSIGYENWYPNSAPDKLLVFPEAARKLIDAYGDLENGGRVALLASLPQSFELEVPGQE